MATALYADDQVALMPRHNPISPAVSGANTQSGFILLKPYLNLPVVSVSTRAVYIGGSGALRCPSDTVLASHGGVAPSGLTQDWMALSYVYYSRLQGHKLSDIPDASRCLLFLDGLRSNNGFDWFFYSRFQNTDALWNWSYSELRVGARHDFNFNAAYTDGHVQSGLNLNQFTMGVMPAASRNLAFPYSSDLTH